jgi:hypothetical protein
MQQDWRKRHFGLFALLAVLIIVGALALDVFVNRLVTLERTSAVAVEQQIGSLEVALADLRAAQAAYVATSQNPEFWMQRSVDLSSRLESGLTQLRESVGPDEARSGYQSALGTLATLATLDKKARAYVQDDQRFLASDVVFLEAVEPNQRLAGDLARLRAARTAEAGAFITRMSWLRLGATGLAMGLVLLVALRLGKPVPLSPATEAALKAQMIRELPPVVKSATPAVARPPSPVAAAASAPAAPPAPPPAPSVNLAAAAELCVDLARVMDTRDVPALLERAARVLDAKGVIVWMADPAAGALHPSLSHGYPDKVLSRLGTLDVDADNVTSLAFRSVRPQIMPGDSPGAAGAVAVPLVTSAGCSGVLAAELRETRPAPELLALTRIVAAQFATMIAPAELAGAARVAEA